MHFQRRKAAPHRENVLPLINVVFLLLVFFMVAGALERGDLFSVAPPFSQSAPETTAQNAVLLMGPTGELALDGTRLTFEDIPQALESLKDSLGPEFKVKLKADGAVEALAVIHVLDRLRAAGVPSVTLLTVEGQP